jgi:FkbM family methyltransferase
MFKLMIKRLVADSILQFYRNARDLLDRNSLSVKTPWGFTIAGNKNMALGDFETEETGLIRKLLEEIDIFVNIGANVGYYCCHALSLGKPVIAVEPIIRNSHYLMRNIQENGWSRKAEVHPVALGEKADILNIYGGNTGASLVKGWARIPESYVSQVPVLTLDRVLGDELDGKRALILVDVEGAEFPMLKGGLRALNHLPRPIWMVEIGSTEHQPEGVLVNPNLVSTFELFYKFGYSAITANRQENSVSLNEVMAVAEGERTFETHNFIFR